MQKLKSILKIGGIMVVSVFLFTACAEEDTGPDIHPLPEGVSYNLTDNQTRDLSYSGCDRIEVNLINATADNGSRYFLTRQEYIDTAKHLHESLMQEHDKVTVFLYPPSGNDGAGNWYAHTTMDFSCDNKSEDYDVTFNDFAYPNQ